MKNSYICSTVAKVWMDKQINDYWLILLILTRNQGVLKPNVSNTNLKDRIDVQTCIVAHKWTLTLVEALTHR